MILDCAECGARYLLADRAIGAEGRQVRCARCGLSWFATPSRYDLVRPLASLPPGRIAVEGATPRVGPVSGPPPRSEWAWPGLRAIIDTVSDWTGVRWRRADAPGRPRRNPARAHNWLAAGSGAVLMLASGTALALANAAPPAPGTLRQRAPVAGPGPVAQPLRIVLLGPARLTRIGSGVTLFAVSGQVRNPTRQRAPVTDIDADLRDARGRPIYSWTIHMPRSMLGPDESVDFDTSQLDVPATVRTVRLGFPRRTSPDRAS